MEVWIWAWIGGPSFLLLLIDILDLPSFKNRLLLYIFVGYCYSVLCLARFIQVLNFLCVFMDDYEDPFRIYGRFLCESIMDLGRFIIWRSKL